MQGENEGCALAVCAIEFATVELVQHLRRRHAAILAEVGRLGQRPIDGKFYQPRVFTPRADLVGLVECLETAVVKETLLADKVEGDSGEGPRRSAVAEGALVGRLGQIIDRFIQQA